jgi:hypothetical protein
MTIAPHYSALHHMVDQLTPTQAEAMSVIMADLVDRTPAPDPTAERTDSIDDMLADEPVRDFSIVGIFQGDPDLAERSKDILRAEFTKRVDADQ